MLLPELVSDVLLRLPVRSLLRFRCLSISICAEIDSADFVNKHLKRSIETKTHQKLIISRSVFFYAADFDDSLRETTQLCCPLNYNTGVTVVCGGVLNGLILVGIIVESGLLSYCPLMLWNPFTRRYKNIPSYECTSFDQFCTCGLGYDSALDDYKILKLSRSRKHEGVQVLVFSWKSNSWRRIEDAEQWFACGSKIIASTTGSALYWMCCESLDLNGVTKILGFDVANEVFFNVTQLPGFCTQVNSIYNFMLVLDGNLYLARTDESGFNLEFYLQVSNKDGDEAEGSWRKAFVVDEGKVIEFGCLRPLTYSKEGEDNILLGKENKFFWYNHEKRTSQRVDINITWSCDWEYDVCPESLVSLGNDSAFDAEAEFVSANKLRKLLFEN